MIKNPQFIQEYYGEEEWNNYAKNNFPSNSLFYQKALLLAVEEGLQKKIITKEMIKEWYQILAKEIESTTEKINKEDFFSDLSNDIKNKIERLNSNPADVNFVEIIADIFCEMEANSSLDPLRTSIANLIISYLLSFFTRPIFLFSPSDIEKYKEASKDRYKMCIFISEKIRDAIFFQNVLLKKIGGDSASEWYKAEGSSSDIDLIVEWHELFDAIEEWKTKIST